MARAKGLSDRRILWRHALAAVEPHAAHGRRPQLRHAHRRRGRGRGDLRDPRARHAHLPGDQRPPVRRAAELHRDHRHLLRAPQLRHRRALHRARPEDPSCPAPERPTLAASSSATPTGRGMPVDAGTIEIAAVETGPEVRAGDGARGIGVRRRGSRSAGSRSSSGSRILAPVLPLDDPKAIITDDRPPRSVRRRRHRARPPARRRLQRPRHAVAPHLGRAHHAARRDARGDHRLRPRRRCSGSRRLLPRQGRHRRQPGCSTCSSPSPR